MQGASTEKSLEKSWEKEQKRKDFQLKSPFLLHHREDSTVSDVHDKNETCSFSSCFQSQG